MHFVSNRLVCILPSPTTKRVFLRMKFAIVLYAVAGLRRFSRIDEVEVTLEWPVRRMMRSNRSFGGTAHSGPSSSRLKGDT